MKYEPGALVILTHCANPQMQHHVGTLHALKVRCTVYANAWDLDPPVFELNGQVEGSWTQNAMRLIDNPPDSATDETLQWLPVSHRDEVPA